MTLVAVASAKGSPGVTVSCLALALAWSRSVLLAECDPAGGDVLAGYLGGQVTADRGLARLAVADRHGRLFHDFGTQLVDLGADRRGAQRWLLPGITDPAQAGNLTPVWERLAGYLLGLEAAEPPFDVIADCGRLAAAHPPVPVLRHAEVVLLAVRPTLVSLTAAVPAVGLLRRELGAHGRGVLRLLVIGTGDYPPDDVARQLGVAVGVQVPDEPATARLLTTGAHPPRASAPLLRAARTAEDQLRRLVRTRQTAPTPTGTAGPGRTVAHVG